jgi:hypothetical protein
MKRSVPVTSALTELAAVSDFLLTKELARFLRCKSQTIYKAYSEAGHYLGIRPLKLGSRNLWRIKDVLRVLDEEPQGTPA